jgi:FkbM family methyltransferase
MLKFDDKLNINFLRDRINGVERAYKIPADFNGNGIAVDVGANIGGFPIVNHAKFNRIICIEPSEYSYNECIKNTKAFNNVEVNRYAVSNESNKILKLKSHIGSNFSVNASTLIHEEWDENNFEIVETISLEDIFNKFHISNIDYLKVDCEGGEYDFLMNKNFNNINYLSIELHIQLKEKMAILEKYLNQFYVSINQIGDGITSHKEITFKNKLL